MNLLLFSDLHADTDAAHRLVALAKSADVLVGAGDFGNMHRDVSRCLDILRSIDKPFVLVAGNNETTDELTAACRDWPQAHILHGSGTRTDGIDFFGLGGGIPVTPFGSWSFDFTEEQAANLLSDCPENCVLITHSPPRGSVDQSSRGEHLGSTAIREAVERVRPALVVCGHIHGSAGQRAMIGTTPIVNAGSDGTLWNSLTRQFAREAL